MFALRLLLAGVLAVSGLGQVAPTPAPPGSDSSAARHARPTNSTAPPGSDSSAARYVWPTGGPVPVLAPFAPPSVPWASGHRGVDLELEVGSAVRAAGEGTVIYAGTLVDRGVVSIEHEGGLRTTYEPMEPVVRKGEWVGRGQVIGTLAPGHCEGGCLHLGARTGPDTYMDPLDLFGTRRVRLFPLEAAPPGPRMPPPGAGMDAVSRAVLDVRLADVPV